MMRLRRLVLMPIVFLLALPACGEETNQTDMAILLYLLARRLEPTRSCTYVSSSTRQNTCAQNPGSTSDIGSVCSAIGGFGVALGLVSYSSSTCEDQGFSTCTSTNLFGSITYDSCT